MSYSEKTLQTKFGSLDETQATIIAISEWVLFHHRNAEQSIKTWSDYILSSPSNQKLPLFYLANEIIQKARSKKREEFISGFAEVLPNVLSQVYPRLDPKIQQKYKRVLDIWRDRAIFGKPVLSRFYDAIKSGSGEKKGQISAPKRNMTEIAPELIPLSSAYNRLSHSSSLFSSSHLKFESIFDQLFNNDYNLPAPDIFISKLDQLAKLNNNSTNSLNDIISIRESLIRDLNRVIQSQNELIQSDKNKLEILSKKGKQVDEKRKELEEYVSGDHAGMDVDAEEEEDDDELVPTYASSDSEDGNAPPPKKAKIDETSNANQLDEETSPQYDDGGDSDSESEVETPTTKSINPNLASLLSKLSE